MKPLPSPRLESFEAIVADVLAKVPKGSSPVFSLLPEVWASTQVIAPEKTDVLLGLLREVKLYPRDATFRFATSGDYLHLSEGALNLIWCASYSSWFIYKAFGRAETTVRFDRDPETAKAVDLYQWAMTSVRDQKYTPWPTNAPKPSRNPTPGSELHIANEVFLVTIAWMLLHEHGHIAYQHPMGRSTDAQREEHDADRFATNHVLGGVVDYDIRFKRSVGIVVANALLLLLELMNGPRVRSTHPPVEERISRNLRGDELGADDRIHAFATALLQFNLGCHGIYPVVREHEQFGDFIDDFCLAVNRWRKNA